MSVELSEPKLMAIYGHISRLYSSAISHFFALLAVWLGFVYASKTTQLDILAKIVIGLVLMVMGGYSWVRILTLTRILLGLESLLKILDFKEKEFFSFKFAKRVFRRKDTSSFTLGEITITIALVSLYLITFLSIMDVIG